MTAPGLFLLLLLLISRFPLIMEDGPPRMKPMRAWFAAGIVALAIFTALEGFWRPLVATALLTANVGRVVLERRGSNAKRRLIRFGIRLVSLPVAAALLIIYASPGFGLRFRDLHPLLSACARWCSPLEALARVDGHRIAIVGIGLLLCLGEANLVIRAGIEWLKLKPGQPSPAEEYRRGRIIGMLERTLVFALVLGGQYGALGFVMAAKALARFKNLDEQDFAEYFLVGTLLSVTIAGAAALATRAALGI
ncbi:MAG: hypothetical protein JST05_07080 [Acidobacteria bacterium]|nr:hypothetical protein [Acidobacteriota bacterium]